MSAREANHSKNGVCLRNVMSGWRITAVGLPSFYHVIKIQIFSIFGTAPIIWKYKILISAFDTPNQPYIFCFDKFYEANSRKLNEYVTI